MKQVHKSGGGAWGGVRVNEKILELIRDMTGQEVMSEFSSNHCNEEYHLRMEIETSKRKVDSPAKLGEENAEEQKFYIRMPQALQRIWRSKCKAYKEVLSANDVKFEAGELYFKSDKIREYFKDTIDGILTTLRDALESSSSIKPGAMIVVGGFAESNYVIESLRESLEDKMIPVLKPDFPEKSVLNGAVLFGQNDEIIKSRIVPHTYGIAMTMEFNSRLHSNEEKYVESDGKEMANNVFRKHVTVGDSVEIGKWITSKEYYITSEETSISRVYVFTSDKKNPIHTTETGSKYIGHLDIEFPDIDEEDTDEISNRKVVQVEFNFCGTLLRVRAVSTCSGKTQTRELQIKYNEMFKEQKE
ncbi:heat shock 70 kDa protein 12A-like [Mercenaria mercenaria]|uniref:heat shock 70 kDa protein 12A-like n=1 Tax=Mercenaria mercenaria TaxID=6596 RepID=UPI00234F3676|nr:heat shock 70 kDa protein 12A-like [Mercenaria mercenaria]